MLQGHAGLQRKPCAAARTLLYTQGQEHTCELPGCQCCERATACRHSKQCQSLGSAGFQTVKQGLTLTTMDVMGSTIHTSGRTLGASTTL